MKMFSIQFVTNMFYLIMLLQHSMLQDCAATEMDIISKNVAVVTSTSSPILKHLLRTGILDSDVKVSRTVSETEILNNNPQNYSYKVQKDMEINQKGKGLGTNSTTDAFNVKQNDDIKGVPNNNATIDLSKLAYSKFVSTLKYRLHQMIAKAFPKYGIKSNSFEVDSEIKSESTEAHSGYISNSSEKKSDGIPRSYSNEKAPTGRQFVFHPYLPYGKDVAPDEKISIGDVLPVKMMKFFKGMVEDAPWEQMFMKMVRMIVDQFVDKIIEKMFSHKDDDHDEWRSSDGGSAKSAWSLPKNVLTYVVRSKRSTEGKAKSERVQDWIEKDLPSSNRVSKEDRSKTKKPTEEESWLDSILDYLFPDDPKAADDSEKERRKRRDANQPLQDSDNQMSGIMRSFLARYLKFHTEQLSPESMNAIVIESIRHKMSEIISQDNSNHEDSKLPVSASSSMSKNTVSDTSQVNSNHEESKLSVAASSSMPRNTVSDTSQDHSYHEDSKLLVGASSLMPKSTVFDTSQVNSNHEESKLSVAASSSMPRNTVSVTSQDHSYHEDSKLLVGASSLMPKSTVSDISQVNSNHEDSKLSVAASSSMPRNTVSDTSQDHSNHEDSKLSVGASSSMKKNTVSDTSLDSKLTDSVDAPAKSSLRTKRSTSDDTDKDEEEERLWQANRRTRPSNRKSREDCSLRRACNAGRLLSRLPSVQDITMQLKAYGSEPHWDALLWGMTKKRCSRIFCKRQRSPKGTKHHWDGPEKRFHRKNVPSSRSSRFRYDESDLTTIYPV